MNVKSLATLTTLSAALAFTGCASPDCQVYVSGVRSRTTQGNTASQFGSGVQTEVTECRFGSNANRSEFTAPGTTSIPKASVTLPAPVIIVP